MPTSPAHIDLVEQWLEAHACVRCGAAHGWYRPHCRYRCAACGWRYRPDRLRRELTILRYFCLEISAHRVARELGMSTPPIWHRFMAYRRWMARLAEAEARPLTGELECDESYFGGRRRGGRRGRAVGQKVIVFGILERQGRVSTVIVPRADEATLMREIERRALKGAVFYRISSRATGRSSSMGSISRWTTARATGTPDDAGGTSTASRASGATPRSGS